MTSIRLLSSLLFIAIANASYSNFTVFYKYMILPDLSANIQLQVYSVGNNQYSFYFNIVSSDFMFVFVNNKLCNNNCNEVVSDGENVTLSISELSYDTIVFHQSATDTQVIYGNCIQSMDACRTEFIHGYSICVCTGLDPVCNGDQVMQTCDLSTTSPAIASTISSTISSTFASKTTSSSIMTPSPTTTYNETSTTTRQLTSSTRLWSTFTTVEPTNPSTITSITKSTTILTKAPTMTPTAASSTSSKTTQQSTSFTRLSTSTAYNPTTTSKPSTNQVTRSTAASRTNRPSTTTMLSSTSIATMLPISKLTFPTTPTTTYSTASTPSVTTTPTSTSTTPKIITNTITVPKSTGTTTQLTATVPTTTELPLIPHALQNISDSGVGLNNVSAILNTTYTFSDQGPALKAQDIFYISNILNDSANLVGLEGEDAIKVLLNMDSVMNANLSQIQASQSSNSFISLLPTMVANTKADVLLYLNGENMGFASNRLNGSALFNGLMDTGTEFDVIRGTPSNNKDNIIYVPANFGEECTTCGKASHFVFTIYRNRKFFSGKKKYRTYSMFDETDDNNETLPSKCNKQLSVPPDSPVMSATLMKDGSEISQLATLGTMARMQFNVTELLRPLHGNYKVTWWDELGEVWSETRQCTSKLKNGVVQADCPHLTDFTLIIDGMVDDPAVCEPALVDLGIATNAISMTSLSLLLFIQISAYLPILATTAILRRLRGDAFQARDSVQLLYNAVLFLFYFVFAIFSDQKISGDACSFAASLAYSLLLCSLLLTIFQALRTVMKFFPHVIQNIIMIILRPMVAITICFLIPFILSLALGFFTPFFKRNDGFCWVRPDLIINAIIIPVTILIINAIVCTSLVCWKLFGATKKFRKQGRQHNGSGQLRAKVIAVIIMQVTMGMPWILQYLTLYHSNATVWHYVFTVVMGSQGTILTLLFFYKRRKIQQSSKRFNKRRLVSSGHANYSLGGFYQTVMSSFVVIVTQKAMRKTQEEDMPATHYVDIDPYYRTHTEDSITSEHVS